MSTIRLFLLLLCMVRLGITLVPAGNAAAAGTALEPAGAPTPRAEAVVRGISVTLEETTSRLRSHLRVDICGPDVTRLPHGFPLGVEVSATVQSVVVRSGAGIAIGVQGRGPPRDGHAHPGPLPPPGALAGGPAPARRGGLRGGPLLLGAARYPLPTALPVGHPTVVLGPGCDERYAGEPALGNGGGHG